MSLYFFHRCPTKHLNAFFIQSVVSLVELLTKILLQWFVHDSEYIADTVKDARLLSVLGAHSIFNS